MAVEALEGRLLLSSQPLESLGGVPLDAADAHSRFVDVDGRLLEMAWDPPPPPSANPGVTPLAASVPAEELHPLSAIPQLHSDPDARAKLFLDFDGHFQRRWGDNYNVVTPVYDKDGDATTFSDGELAVIEEVWARVAEDYLPFNIDVTTVDPDDAVTELNEMASIGRKIRTFYFRHSFEVGDAGQFENLVVRLKRDDGAAVYLNGVEIVRDNLDADADFDDHAEGSVSGGNEDTFFPFTIDLSTFPAGTLVDGENVLAVEVHQESDGSSDVSFDLRLEGATGGASNVTLVPGQSKWKYLDDGSNRRTAWRDPGFDDSAWPSGTGEFGYGEGDEATVLSDFEGVDQRVRTFYFRRGFQLDDVSTIANVRLRLLRDDGAAVYLNGTEIRRDNLASNAAYDDFASGTTGTADESTFFESVVSAGLLVEGLNVLAVEVHQATDTSSDVSFDLQLRADFNGQPMTLVPEGADWKYLDDGSDQGTAWRAAGFDDSTWPIGTAEFGYGDRLATTHVAIGGSSNDWFGGGAGGVAFINAFGLTSSTVAYAFPRSVGNGAKNIAEVAAHEAGHTFGLRHQSTYDETGQQLDEYNPGAGDWAPIMGRAFSRPLSTWHNGTSSQSATSYQDDLARIASPGNGIGYRADDHGDVPPASTPLAPEGGSVEMPGIIETNDDVDVFSFWLAQDGGVSFTVEVAPVGPNLDVVLLLKDSAGRLQAESDPSNSLGATISSSLAAGAYTLWVRNNGQYGRLGQYTVRGDLDEGLLQTKELQHVSPLGSLMVTSTGNVARINFPGDRDEFEIFAQAGQLVSAVITPVDPAATLTAELIGQSDVIAAPQPGAVIRVPPQLVETDGDYRLRVVGDVPTAYEVTFGVNLIFEQPGTADGSELAIDASALARAGGRLGVLGHSGDGQDASIELVPAAATWTYLDDGSDQGTTWRDPGFDDSGWSSGAGPFGYGEGGESTLLAEHDANGQRVRTFYFRQTFRVDDVSRLGQVVLRLLRDDGAAVYLNGTEIRRDHLSSNAGFNDFATANVSGSEEDKYFLSAVSSDLLVQGENVLAVELHQRNDSSADAAFHLELVSESASESVDTLLPPGERWGYVDDGSDQGTAWRAVDFDDSDWRQARAEFGYGDNDEQTLIREHDVQGDRIRTFYFRRRLTVADPAEYEKLLIHLKYDDGAAVYLNGVEVVRDNLRADTAFDDFASGSAPDEDAFLTFSADAALLVPGENVLAVEVHQRSDGSSDVSFDMVVEGVLVPIEVDEYTLDLTGRPGRLIDVVLEGQDVDFADQRLELLDVDAATVLATAVTPDTRTAETNYDLAILDFPVPGDGVYTLRLTSVARGDYGIVVADALLFESEPNDAPGDSLRRLNGRAGAAGWLNADGSDGSDLYELELAAGEHVSLSTEPPFAHSPAADHDDLDCRIVVRSPSGSVVAADANSADAGLSTVSFIASESGVFLVEVQAEAGAGEYLLLVESLVGAVRGRYVFYNNSAFDGSDASANADDDYAIAPDKTALLPGQKATFANYTSYNRGINGIMVDVEAGILRGLPTVDDFTFRIGNDNDPTGWARAPEPDSVAVRPGDGVGGSDRLTVIWPDGAITKQWLQVALLATQNTGLAVPDVFYFGNAVGEAGNSTLNAVVNATDEIGARNFQHGPVNLASIVDPYDYDRDRLVDTADRTIARNSQTGPLSALRLIKAPTGAVADAAILLYADLLAEDLLVRETEQESGMAEALLGSLDWLYDVL